MGRGKRTRYNALASINEPAWLVVRDRHNELASPPVELAPGADPSQVLAAAIEHLEADGWVLEEPPNQSFAGAYLNRGDARWFVHIARADPLGAPASQNCSVWSVPSEGK